MSTSILICSSYLPSLIITDLIFKDTKRYFEFKNKIPLRFTPKIYQYWLQDFDQKLHVDITKNMKRFIESKRYLTLNQNIDTFYK